MDMTTKKTLIWITSMLTNRRYSELKNIKTYAERFDYLRAGGKVGDSTFGFERYLNQSFYKSTEWIRARRQVIIRDNGCDMGVEGYDISGPIVIHHMNPITPEDLEHFNPDILNPEYLVCVSVQTHKAIHYGDSSLLPKTYTPRTPNDTCPWKR